MARQLLTDLVIKSLAPRSGQYEYFDDYVRGLAIRVSPGGTRSFVLLYRHGGRARRLTLGRYPAVTLKVARQRALEALGRVAAGEDPQSIKRNERLSQSSKSFPLVAEQFIELYAKRNTKSWREAERIIKREFVARWKQRRLSDICKQDVPSILDELVEFNGPSAANHAFAAIRKFFNWCVERGELSYSPCAGLKSPAKNVSRDRVLSKAEITSILLASVGMGSPFGHFVRLLFLTAQRRTEVAHLQWSHIDIESKTWTQPAEANKSKRTHLVPLSEAAIAVILDVQKPRESPFIFESAGGFGPISGFSKWKKKLDTLSGTANWTLHDIRRTVTTGLAELGVSDRVADLILNHQSVAANSIAKVYNRHEYMSERRTALEMWAKHLEDLIGGSIVAARQSP